MKSQHYAFVMIITLLCLCSLFPTSSQNLPDVIDRAESSVVTIYSTKVGQNWGSQGSGFFITPDTVITNYHVMDSFFRGIDDSAFVKTYDGEYHEVTDVLAVDMECDLAIIRVDAFFSATLPPLNISLPRKGESVFVIGSPIGLEYTVTRGIVSSVRQKEGFGVETQVIQYDASTSPGASGSPLINEKGEVIGVVSFGFSSPGIEGLNFAIPAQRVYRLASVLYGEPDYDGDWVADRFDFYPEGNGKLFCDITYYNGEIFPDEGGTNHLDPYFIIAVDVNGDYNINDYGTFEYWVRSTSDYSNTEIIRNPLSAVWDIPDNVQDVNVLIEVWDDDAWTSDERIDVADGPDKVLVIPYDTHSDIREFVSNGANDFISDEADAALRFTIGITE